MSTKKKTSWIVKAAIIIGVLVIPLLYSYFYLSAFWDPYARLNDVPVAVVNLDKGAEINGKQRNIGNEICDNLKKNDTLKFVFTDEDDAKKGVLGKDYYASITIPADFSADAATVSKDTKKLHGEIIYSANQKKNYLAAQILENAMPTIKQTVNASIDEEIVSTLSDKLNSIPGTMGELQDGLGKLSDGSQELYNGTGTLVNGTDKLSSGSQQLATGSKTLSDGSVTLKNGMQTLDNGTKTLTNSVPALSNGVQKLTDGAAALKNGTNTLNGKVPALTSGITALNSGAGQLSNGLDTLKANNDALTSGASRIKDGAAQLSNGLDEYTGGVSAINTGAQTLQTGLNSYTSGVESASQGASQLYSGVQAASSGINTITSQVEKSSKMLDSTASDETLNKLSGGAKQVSGGLNQFNEGYSQALAALKLYQQTGNNAYLTAAVNGFDTLNSNLGTLKDGASQVNSGVDTLTSGMKEVRTSTANLLGGLKQVQQGFGSTSNGKTIVGGSYALDQGLKKLSENNAQLNGGATQISLGLMMLNNNSSALNSGVKQLQSGADTLNTGLTTYTNGVSSAADGATQLAAGTKTLNASAPALANGVKALDNGAGQLSGGLNTLNAKVPALANGATALASGADKLLDGTKTLSNGAVKLTSGAVQLNNGVATLKSGSTKLQDGAKALNNGINTAKTGVDDTVNDTEKQLKALDGLPDYAKEPVTTKTEYVEPVANYGSAFAPYFMGLSLWVGGLMIYFGIYLDYNRKIKNLTKDSHRIIFRTILFGAISALQGVLLGFVIQHVLHISVAHPLMLYGSCILVSLTFMTIIQFCIVNLGDAGKLVSLLLLILQLTSCAGTFPIETQNHFFNVISKYLPMTYSTQLFKEALAGTAGSNARESAIILAIFFAVFLALTLIFSHNSLKRELQRIELETKEKIEDAKAASSNG